MQGLLRDLLVDHGDLVEIVAICDEAPEAIKEALEL
jgi:hypothetical protein